MAANRSKRQVAKVFADAGVQMPSMKLTPEELQARLNQRPATFQDRRTRKNRSRTAQRRNSIAMAY